MKQGSTKLNTMTNLVFVLTDVLETNLLDMQHIYGKEGFELRQDAKRNFNKAIHAIKCLKHDVDKCSYDTQDNFGNDADMLNAMIKMIIDRTGDDDEFTFKLFNYIKAFPSKRLIDTDGLDDAFGHLNDRK